VSRGWVRALAVAAGALLLGVAIGMRETEGGWLRNMPGWWYTASVIVAYALGRRTMLRELSQEMRRAREREFEQWQSWLRHMDEDGER